MPQLPKPSQLTSQGVKRFWTYALAIAVLLGIVAATLIAFGYMSEEQFKGWVVMIGVTVPAMVGIVTSIMALFNVEKAPDQQRISGRHAAETESDADEHDPKLGGKPRNQV